MTTELRMSAYYFSFESTGVPEVDRVLSAVAWAGKSSHHTNGWTDVPGYRPDDALKGESPVEWIQNAAKAAAAELESLRATKPGKCTCAYCGASQEPSTLEALQAHVMECPKHPIRQVLAERDREQAERKMWQERVTLCRATQYREERDAARKELDALRAGQWRWVCAWCGYEADATDKQARAEAITSHAVVCKKHPAGEVTQVLERVQAERDAALRDTSQQAQVWLSRVEQAQTEATRLRANLTTALQAKDLALDEAAGAHEAADIAEAEATRLRTAMSDAVKALEATRWNPSGSLLEWAQKVDGQNHQHVMNAFDYLRGCLTPAPAPEVKSFPVTDPEDDAPDGATVDGFTRVGATWEKEPAPPAAKEEEPECDLCAERMPSLVICDGCQGEAHTRGKREGMEEAIRFIETASYNGGSGNTGFVFLPHFRKVVADEMREHFAALIRKAARDG